MKILFACGGTAGHINPALAVANYIREQYPEADIRFAGNPRGMEARLVPQAGYPFLPIRVMGLQRRLSLKNIKLNIQAACLLLTATSRAKKLISDFGPDVVMGTGGYVSGPVVLTAAKMGIPTVSHEQNAFPGLTTKALCAKVDKMLLATEAAKKHLPQDREYIVTGNPVRQEIVTSDRAAARAKLGVGDRICILSFGGSLGADRINEAVSTLMAQNSHRDDIHHIHATGAYGVEDVPMFLQQQGANYPNPHLDIREYIHDMPDCLAAADLVISRAGATSISELQAAGKASVLIPSPNVAENHQYHNAMALQNRQAAVVLEEKDLSGQSLCDVVNDILSQPGRLAELGANAAKMAIMDANRRIAGEVLALIGSRSK
ncbi:MAG: undecaprenyldiphospho-muramoylpentapeptide beta-N-acetylglucosaminyltransferase [Oscillospiraceae bacterium]|nr:undecaprenyldiphospho-muramoylpentapeptide beta-N-acetylglucosaminyltransferase [Oscillospiraceae bacterium]